MINKSASEIGTLRFKNGNTNTLFVGRNRNTGELIVWQKPSNKAKSQRTTGRNIVKALEELQFLFAEGEAEWVGARNDTALDALLKEVGLKF